METERVQAALQAAKEYIENLTVRSEENRPERVVPDEKRFFSWDNEKRSPAEEPYLFDWSYYNGVVMEGLFDVYETAPEQYGVYLSYVKAYLDAMIVTKPDGTKELSRNLAGYVDCHGVDCYKTAALLVRMSSESDAYMEIAGALYRDVADPEYRNSKGNIVALEFTEEKLGHNYWHGWAGGRPFNYIIWLDGIYMLQPFLAHYAAKIGDDRQLALINERLDWVADNMLAPNGLYYHACNSRDDVCPYHWTRAIGWYAMAMTDVMEVLPESYLARRKQALKLLTDGMIRCQDPSGMWANMPDRPVTDTNRLETSGTAMMVYAILKAVRHGWLEESYRAYAVRAFVGMTELKLKNGSLTDIYLKVIASNANNYERVEYYLPDEGKGSGPFIMAYSEMLYL